MSFIIATDTSANLPTEYIKENNISILPFHYYIEGEENDCLDINYFDGRHFYESMREGKLITTSQINPQSFFEFFEPIAEKDGEVLFISMSSGISGSYNSANIAKSDILDDYPDAKIEIVDTLGASLGEGINVYEAVKCRESGMSLKETAEYLDKFKKNVAQVFTVDDLMYLKRSGRISNAAAIVGNVLQIKPMLKGNSEGKIVNYAKARSRRRAIEALVDKYIEIADHPEENTLYISHADCQEDLDKLLTVIKEKKPPKDFVIVCHEPVTGSHVGPGMLALFFKGIEGCREM